MAATCKRWITGESSLYCSTVLPDYGKEYLTVTKCKASFLLQEQFGIWITFLRHHIHELQTVKYGPVFMAWINWYFPCSIVCLIWCKGYLNVATFRILVLLSIELNILAYWAPSSVIIYRSYIHLQRWSGFLGPPCTEITSVLFTVLWPWHDHCQRSLGSFGDNRTTIFNYPIFEDGGGVGSKATCIVSWRRESAMYAFHM